MAYLWGQTSLMSLECRTPIVFIVFNRPEHTRRVFQRIAQVRPTQLLVVADAARTARPGEDLLCREVREIATRVDWPCKLQTNFATENFGCRQRVITGLNWAFEQVEDAIILEDDILPDPSFFPFCEAMLDRFRNDSRVSMITGFNIVQDHLRTEYSYFFSRLTHIWGWATWRRAWLQYDEHLSHWPEIRDSGLMAELFPVPAHRRFWTRIFDQMHNGTGPNTWDYQWMYTNLMTGSLSIVPRVNLIENIGFGPGATHTSDASAAPQVKAQQLPFPLAHPPAMVPLAGMDRLDQELSGCRIPGLHRRAIHKLKRELPTLFKNPTQPA